VAGALLNQVEDDEAEISGLEETSWTSSATASIEGAGWAAKVTFMVMTAEVKFEARASMVCAVFVVGLISVSHDLKYQDIS